MVGSGTIPAMDEVSSDMTALALRLDDRRDDLGAVDDAAEVDRDHAVPFLEFVVVGRTIAADPGIVGEDMDLPENVERLLRGTAQILAVGDIDADEMGSVVAFEDVARLGDVILVPVRHDHLHALGEEIASHTKADATCAAGHERHFAREILHLPLLFSVRPRLMARCARCQVALSLGKAPPSRAAKQSEERGMQRILVIGAGAMGCLFAARIAESGADVMLIDVDEARLAAIADRGISLTDDNGTRTVSPAHRTGCACGREF